jgi:hypothetical protein
MSKKNRLKREENKKSKQVVKKLEDFNEELNRDLQNELLEGIGLKIQSVWMLEEDMTIVEFK